MKSKDKKAQESLLKGVSVAYLIIFLNILLVMALGLLVLFLSGIINYMMWIFFGGLALILSGGFFLYRKFKQGRQSLDSMANSQAFAGQPLEISFLGGIASIKLGDKGESNFNHQIDYSPSSPIPQLEDPGNRRLRELKELSDLLKDNLITRDEYDRVKARIFESAADQHSSNLK